MLRFIVRRLLQLVPILLGLSVLLFAWLRALPGGPAQAALGERATPEDIARYNELFGLDQPIYVQYLKWMRLIASGNFGMSMEWRRPVSEVIGERLWLTVVVSVAALLLTWALALDCAPSSSVTVRVTVRVPGVA